METGINSYIREQFDLKEVDLRTYSPLVLAYIGDAVFDLVIRTVVVGRGNTSANKLHRRTSHIVKAQTQAMMIEKLLPHLTEEESGLEALIGHLYLTDQFDRILFLIKEGTAKINERI